MNQIEKTCVVCSSNFLVNSSSKKECCSTECSTKLRTSKSASARKPKYVSRCCEVCQSIFEMLPNSNKRTCSKSCGNKLPRNLPFGEFHHMKTDSSKEKVKQTTIDRYGGIGVASKQLNQKFQVSMIEKYGENHPSKVFDIRSKAVASTNYEKVTSSKEATLLKKYGVKNAMQNQVVSRKSADSRWSNDDNKIYFDIRTREWWENNYIGKKTTIKSLTEKFGVGHSILTKVSQELGIEVFNQYGVSEIETRLRDAVAEFANVVFNTKQIISPKEIDIYLPDQKIAIEVNGVYWHSEIAGKKHRLYHHEKMKMCNDRGIRLFQFWDFEIENNFELVVGMIKNACGINPTKIYARKCQIQPLDKTTALQFIARNHLSPNARFSKAFGLYHENELVSCITFGQSRFRKRAKEIIRFCSKTGTNVIGGFSKLLKMAGTGTIVSYSDNRYSQGNVYKVSGFSMESEGNATMWFTRDYKSLIHRSAAWGKATGQQTQKQAMIHAGFDIVYDAGQTTWIKELK